MSVFQAITRGNNDASVTSAEITAAIRTQLKIDVAPELLDLQRPLATAGLHTAALRCTIPGIVNSKPVINILVS